MRQVTQKIVSAFLKGEKARCGNTSTDGRFLSLHGNDIATRLDDGFMIETCGWFTLTTKERLNGLPGVKINQKAGKWYLNGQEWDGKATFVKYA